MTGAFGFEVPTGDPGALNAAAGSWRTLGAALDAQGQAVGTGAGAALSAGSWEGSAASRFSDEAERLVKAFVANVGACGRAASALRELAQALEQAQQATRQAMTECEQYQTEAASQQAAAAQAGQAAQAAHQSAAGAVHPSAISAYNQEAARQQQLQSSAQSAATRAQDGLKGAQARGRAAAAAYEHQAQAVTAQLHAAAAELQAPGEMAGWAEPAVTWAGRLNDVAGAGTTALIKSYNAVITKMTDQMEREAYAFLSNPGAWENPANVATPLSEVDDALAAGGLSDTALSDARMTFASGLTGIANSPVSKALTRGIVPEGSFGAAGDVLSKVPIAGVAFTGLDMYMNRNKGIGDEFVQPIGNLALGTGLAEGTSSVIASVGVSDGLLTAVGGSALIPGVGEVVITGAVVVGGVMAVDWAGHAIWDHRAAIVHGVEHAADWTYNEGKSLVQGAVHEGKSLVHGAEQVLSDLNPFG